MWQIFLKYMPSEIIQEQFSQVNIQKRYDYSSLIKKYEEYIKLCEYGAGIEVLKMFWIEEIGGAQAKMPEHVFFEFSRFLKVIPMPEENDFLIMPSRETLNAYAMNDENKISARTIKASTHLSRHIKKGNPVIGENCALTQQFGLMDTPPTKEQAQQESKFITALFSTRRKQYDALGASLLALDLENPHAENALKPF